MPYRFGGRCLDISVALVINSGTGYYQPKTLFNGFRTRYTVNENEDDDEGVFMCA